MEIILKIFNIILTTLKALNNVIYRISDYY